MSGSQAHAVFVPASAVDGKNSNNNNFDLATSTKKNWSLW